MREPSLLPDAADSWGLDDDAPLLGVKSALLLGFGALALLFSLAT